MIQKISKRKLVTPLRHVFFLNLKNCGFWGWVQDGCLEAAATTHHSCMERKQRYSSGEYLWYHVGIHQESEGLHREQRSEAGQLPTEDQWGNGRSSLTCGKDKWLRVYSKSTLPLQTFAILGIGEPPWPIQHTYSPASRPMQRTNYDFCRDPTQGWRLTDFGFLSTQLPWSK